MSINVQFASDNAADRMDPILKLFKPGAKITVIVRNSLAPGDTDLILTDDDLTEIRGNPPAASRYLRENDTTTACRLIRERLNLLQLRLCWTPRITDTALMWQGY